MPHIRKSPNAGRPLNRARFRERADLLDFLLEVSSVTSETLDLDRLLANIAEIVKEVIPYDLFAILLYNERSRALKIRYAIGHRDEIAKNLSIRIGEGIAGAAAASRQPVLVSDVRADSRYLNALDIVRSELACPMLVRGTKIVGVIDLESTRVNAFSEEDRALLALIASRVGIAIDNARLYRRIERQNRTLRVLAHLSREFSSILDVDELLTKVATTVHTFVSFDAFSIFLVDEEQRLLRCRFSQRYDEKVTADIIDFGRGITGAAAESREPVRVADVAQDPRYIQWRTDIRSEVAVPLILRDRVVGVMDLESVRYGFFTEEHTRALTLLAPQIAISVENARLYEELALRERRMEQDLRAAYNLQAILLPRNVSHLNGLEIGIETRPAREISGDLFDFFDHGEEYTLIAFGDVSGKGAAAALYGALISGILRILAPNRLGPAELMKSINEILLERRVDAQYAVLSLLLWDSRRRIFSIASAGTLPPIICRDGEILQPTVQGIPIGMLEDQQYEQSVLQVQPADTVLLYSDGIEDQLAEPAVLAASHDEGRDDDEYGRERLERLLKSICSLPPRQLVTAIFEDLDRFRGATPLTDDQTAIALRVL